MRSIGGFPVHNYGADGIAEGIRSAAQTYYKKKEQEEEDKFKLVKLTEEKKTTAFDQLMKLEDMRDKYPDRAEVFDPLIQKRYEALGFTYDALVHTDKTSRLKDIQSQIIGDLGTTLNVGLENPTDANIIKATQLFRRATNAKIKDDELESFRPLLTEIVNRAKEKRTVKPEMKGFDASNKPVYQTNKGLAYQDGTPYQGGPLKPTTAQARTPSEFEVYYNAQKAKGIPHDTIVENYKKLGKEPTNADLQAQEKQVTTKIYNSLLESGLMDSDGKTLTFKQSYTPEEYKIIKEEAAKVGYEPVARTTKGREVTLPILGKIGGDEKINVFRFKKAEGKTEITKESAKTDAEISKILKDNGYAPTPENIKQFRKNNP